MQRTGFTLIELVMVVLLLSLLAAVAIPNFIDFRADAKNSATKGILGAVRSAIAVGRAAIALRESPTTARDYPYIGYCELILNAYVSAGNAVSPLNHPVLAGTLIMAPPSGKLIYPNGIAPNPWSSGSFTSVPAGIDANGYATLAEIYVTSCGGSSVVPAVGSSNAEDILIASHHVAEASAGQTLTSKLAFYNDGAGLGGSEAIIVGFWGWGYNEISGEFFAMTANNGATSPGTEFNF